ncbi:PfkB family carbohydrate kinase [Streptomyces shenzhenensis]|uniref:PfkB family carbohydrate kinase n=1 Tax=Streptomyces shenzhenensis TaxID=943815 RepID=UPI0037D9BC04
MTGVGGAGVVTGAGAAGVAAGVGGAGVASGADAAGVVTGAGAAGIANGADAAGVATGADVANGAGGAGDTGGAPGVDGAGDAWDAAGPAWDGPGRTGAAPGRAAAPGPGPDTRTSAPALCVDVVAPVGAGDAFAAGFLSATLRGLPVRDRIRSGHLMAAAALTVPGDLAVPPSRDHADRLLALDDAAWGRLRLGPGWTHAAGRADEEVPTP